jgi:hypothetical protein
MEAEYFHRRIKMNRDKDDLNHESDVINGNEEYFRKHNFMMKAFRLAHPCSVVTAGPSVIPIIKHEWHLKTAGKTGQLPKKNTLKQKHHAWEITQPRTLNITEEGGKFSVINWWLSLKNIWKIPPRSFSRN